MMLWATFRSLPLHGQDSLFQESWYRMWSKAIAKTPRAHPNRELVDVAALFSNAGLAWLLQLICSSKNSE